MANYQGIISSVLERRGVQLNTRTSTGTAVGPHWHDGYEMLFIHARSAKITVGNRTHLLSAGYVAAFNAKHAHRTDPCSQSYVCTPLHFDPELIPGRRQQEWISRIDDQGGVIIAPLRIDATSRVIWTLRDLLNLQHLREKHEVMQYLLGLLLADVSTAEPIPSQEDTHVLLQEVIAYMCTHLERRETNAQLAHRFHVSETHLRHLFRTYMGYSPQRQWNRYRMVAAEERLPSASSILSVAKELGFESLSGFERAFRREMGLRPSDVRSVST